MNPTEWAWRQKLTDATARWLLVAIAKGAEETPEGWISRPLDLGSVLIGYAEQFGSERGIMAAWRALFSHGLIVRCGDKTFEERVADLNAGRIEPARFRIIRRTSERAQ